MFSSPDYTQMRSKPESLVAFLEERCSLQQLVIAELTNAVGQLVKHCHPDKAPGKELDEARIHAINVLTRYTQLTRSQGYEQEGVYRQDG